MEEARRRVAAAGVSIVEDLDQDAFEKAMSPVWDRFVTSPKMESIIGQIKQVTSSQPSEAINHD